MPAPHASAAENGDMQNDPAGHSVHETLPVELLYEPSSHTTCPRAGSEHACPTLQAMQ